MRYYTFVDYATQAYLLVVALLMLVFANERTPSSLWLFPTHLAVMALIHWMITVHARHPAPPWFEFLRYFYPVLLFTGFYRSTGELHHMFFPEYLDPLLIRIEAQIFGGQPSLAFMEGLPYLAISELFYAAYFSYYIMILGMGIVLYLRNRTQFFHYVSVVAFVFYCCYLTYIILPVMGPRAFYRDEVAIIPLELMPAEIPAYPEAVKPGPFYQVMAFIYANFETPGAAFPSSHVALALTTVWFSFLYLRRIRHVHLAVVILLCISTVYCRYHYVIDVFAGILAAALLVPLGHWLFLRFHGPRPLELAQVDVDGEGQPEVEVISSSR
jgi:membrane-associated phospholipid phosphatase